MASYPDNSLKNPITVIGCGSEHADFQGLFDSKSVAYALYRVVRAIYMLNEYMYHFVSPACVQFKTGVTCAPHLLPPNTSVADVHLLLYACMLTSCFPALCMHAHFLFSCSYLAHFLFSCSYLAHFLFSCSTCMLISCFPALTLLTSCFPALYMHAHFLFTCSLSYSLPVFLILLHEHSFPLLAHLIPSALTSCLLFMLLFTHFLFI